MNIKQMNISIFRAPLGVENAYLNYFASLGFREPGMVSRHGFVWLPQDWVKAPSVITPTTSASADEAWTVWGAGAGIQTVKTLEVGPDIG